MRFRPKLGQAKICQHAGRQSLSSDRPRSSPAPKKQTVSECHRVSSSFIASFIDETRGPVLKHSQTLRVSSNTPSSFITGLFVHFLDFGGWGVKFVPEGTLPSKKCDTFPHTCLELLNVTATLPHPRRDEGSCKLPYPKEVAKSNPTDLAHTLRP